MPKNHAHAPRAGPSSGSQRPLPYRRVGKHARPQPKPVPSYPLNVWRDADGAILRIEQDTSQPAKLLNAAQLAELSRALRSERPFAVWNWWRGRYTCMLGYERILKCLKREARRSRREGLADSEQRDEDLMRWTVYGRLVDRVLEFVRERIRQRGVYFESLTDENASVSDLDDEMFARAYQQYREYLAEITNRAAEEDEEEDYEPEGEEHGAAPARNEDEAMPAPQPSSGVMLRISSDQIKRMKAAREAERTTDPRRRPPTSTVVDDDELAGLMGRLGVASHAPVEDVNAASAPPLALVPPPPPPSDTSQTQLADVFSGLTMSGVGGSSSTVSPATSGAERERQSLLDPELQVPPSPRLAPIALPEASTTGTLDDVAVVDNTSSNAPTPLLAPGSTTQSLPVGLSHPTIREGASSTTIAGTSTAPVSLGKTFPVEASRGSEPEPRTRDLQVSTSEQAQSQLGPSTQAFGSFLFAPPERVDIGLPVLQLESSNQGLTPTPIPIPDDLHIQSQSLPTQADPPVGFETAMSSASALALASAWPTTTNPVSGLGTTLSPPVRAQPSMAPGTGTVFGPAQAHAFAAAPPGLVPSLAPVYTQPLPLHVPAYAPRAAAPATYTIPPSTTYTTPTPSFAGAYWQQQQQYVVASTPLACSLGVSPGASTSTSATRVVPEPSLLYGPNGLQLGLGDGSCSAPAPVRGRVHPRARDHTHTHTHTRPRPRPAQGLRSSAKTKLAVHPYARDETAAEAEAQAREMKRIGRQVGVWSTVPGALAETRRMRIRSGASSCSSSSVATSVSSSPVSFVSDLPSVDEHDGQPASASGTRGGLASVWGLFRRWGVV